MSQFYKDSIFWIEVDKIKPNPFQPRREFDEAQLKSLSDSIRQYGVLQALVVTRKETQREDGLFVEYELIAGERRLRASRLAGLSVVPCLIKDGDQSDEVKLELAIIENLQREDLNPIDRAIAFRRLVDEFGFKNVAIAAKVGKSKEYVANSMRMLNLPQEMIDAVKNGKITEGHTRPLLMLIERPEEQLTLFKEIMSRRMTVREAEQVARRVAVERSRLKGDMLDHQTREIEERLTESLGTRVMIEKRHETEGGKITIAFFSNDDLKHILATLDKGKEAQAVAEVAPQVQVSEIRPEVTVPVAQENIVVEQPSDPVQILDDRSKEEVNAAENEAEEDLYSIKNFNI